jgi:hypothetical protein
MINLITPLPFYDNRLEQQQYKENSQAVGLYNHYSDNDNMIPWQFKTAPAAAAIERIKLYSGGYIYDLIPADNPSIKIVTDGTSSWVIYTGGQLVFTRENGDTEDLIIAPGYYEWQITVDGVTKYSEIFFIPDPLSICFSDWKIKIQAWNTENWNGYYFNNEFKFNIYFDTFITNIIATITDDTAKDGFDRPVLSQRVITPTYVINFDPMPNIIAVYLGILTGFKNIIISDRLGNQYQIKNVKFSQDSIEGTSLDMVTFQFTIFDNDYITNFCNN